MNVKNMKIQLNKHIYCFHLGIFFYYFMCKLKSALVKKGICFILIVNNLEFAFILL